MRWKVCLALGLMISAEAAAESEFARTAADLRERSAFQQAEEYLAEQSKRPELTAAERVELTIELALVYTGQALQASPEHRPSWWNKADAACATFIESWPDHPRRALVDVQRALVAFERGQQSRHAGDFDTAILTLRSAVRGLDGVAQAISRELTEQHLRAPAERSPEALSAKELESLQSHVALHFAKAEHQLALCYPAGSADRDDALVQAVNRLTPLARRTPADALTWGARTELAACLRTLGRKESVQKLIGVWLHDNPPQVVRSRLTAASATPPSQPTATRRLLQHDDTFDTEMDAAQEDRRAGRAAAAVERYRNLALRNPRHDRANEAHRLAILSMADWIRSSQTNHHSELAAQYERLLTEHLEQWTTDDDVRLWLAALCISRRDWPKAILALRGFRADSDKFPECARLLTRCYDEQLSDLDRSNAADQQRIVALLTAATEQLQPIITGAENRWPDSWSQLQRDTAIDLARLHLRHTSQSSPYSERLLAAMLRGSAANEETQKLPSWQSSANLLLLEALARNGETAKASTLVDRAATASIDELIATLAALDSSCSHIATQDGDQRMLAEVSLSLVRRVEARAAELDSDSNARLATLRAGALAASGNRLAAQAQLAALAAQYRDDPEIQERYAAFLGNSAAPDELREALAHWERVESRSRRGGPRWQKARRARLDLLTRLGDQAEADKLLRLTRLLYPEWSSTEETK